MVHLDHQLGLSSNELGDTPLSMSVIIVERGQAIPGSSHNAWTGSLPLPWGISQGKCLFPHTLLECLWHSYNPVPSKSWNSQVLKINQDTSLWVTCTTSSKKNFFLKCQLHYMKWYRDFDRIYAKLFGYGNTLSLDPIQRKQRQVDVYESNTRLLYKAGSSDM